MTWQSCHPSDRFLERLSIVTVAPAHSRTQVSHFIALKRQTARLFAEKILNHICTTSKTVGTQRDCVGKMTKGRAKQRTLKKSATQAQGNLHLRSNNVF